MTNATDTIMQRWFEEVWNNGQEKVIDELMAGEAIAHGITEPPNDKGPEGFRQFYRKFREDFSNIRIELDRLFRQEDFEVAHCKVSAVHNESTRPVNFSGVSMARIEEGKIAEAWNYFDFLGLYKQIGLELAPPKSN